MGVTLNLFDLGRASRFFGRRRSKLGCDWTTFWPVVLLAFARIEVTVSSSGQAGYVMSILRKDSNSIINPDGRAGGEGTRALFELSRDSFRQNLGALPVSLGENDRELIAAGPTGNIRSAKGFEA